MSEEQAAYGAGTSMSDLGTLMDAKVSAAEARTDTKIARLEWKLDLVVSKLDERFDALRDKFDAYGTTTGPFEQINGSSDSGLPC